MKKSIVLSVMMAFIFAISHSTTAVSQNSNRIHVNMRKGEDPKMLELRMNNLQKQKTHITIQDLDGKVGLRTTVKNQDGYTTKVNLKLVPDGEYILLVENQNSVYYKAFSMRNNDVALYQKGIMPEAVTRLAYQDKNNRYKVHEGTVQHLENSAANIHFVFIETTQGNYFQFFGVDGDGLAIENGQKVVKGEASNEKLAILDITLRKKD